MIPIVEPVALYAPVAVGLAWLGMLATAGALVVVALVARATRRTPRVGATVVAMPRRFSKAA
jgi:hypothetical protein